MEPQPDSPMLDRNIVPSKKMKQYLATMSASMGALCAGTTLSWTSPALAQILEDNHNLTNLTAEALGAPGFTISHKQAAYVGSTLTIGALLFATPTGILAGKFGRKLTIIGLSLPFILNWILIVFSTNLEMVVTGRFFAGMAVGGSCVMAPMYICEIAEPSLRGKLSSFFAMFLCGGILLTCIFSSFTNWIGLSLILGIFPIIFGVSFCFMPESPIYLVQKNKIDEAASVLQELRGKHYDVSTELETIKKQVEKARESSASIKDIITNKGNLRALISVCGVLAFQQLCGVNAVVFYVSTIFKAAGSSLSPTLASIIINSVQLAGACGSIFIIEKANRKFYLMLSSVGMMLCLVGLGMFFHLKNINIDVTHIGFIPLCSCVVFMIMFSLGYAPVPWMLLGELFSSNIKGIAGGLGGVTNWSFAFLVTFCFPLINADLGAHVAFYMFGGFMAVATLFVYFVVPETRGRTLVQIQEELNR